MKNSRKIIAILLTAFTVFCSLCLSGAAAPVTGKIYFEVPKSWGTATSDTSIYAHIWVNGGEDYAPRQTTAEKMTYVSGQLFSFEVKKSPSESGKNWNLIMFSSDKGQSTYDLTMSADCIGDTAYVTNQVVEHPLDTNKFLPVAEWTVSTANGPHLTISSVGEIIGNVFLPKETIEDVLGVFSLHYPEQATEEKLTELRERLKAYEAVPTEPETATQAATNAPTQATAPTVAPTDTTTDTTRQPGIPLPAGIKMPARVVQASGNPGDTEHPDWDGYYKIYYFKVTSAEWFENIVFKEKGFDIGFYWYYGSEQCAEWPGIPAKRLAGTDDIYYAIAPSYANNIIWNNGIDVGLPTDSDYNPAKKDTGRQTIDINVEDGDFNQLSIDDLCGCLCILGEEIKTELISQRMGIFNYEWEFFDPNTGNSRTIPLTVNDQIVYDVSGQPLNPYYDMDYSYTKTSDAIILGDIDGDKAVTTKDTVHLQKYLAKIVSLNLTERAAADADQNGKIETNDALRIQKYLAKIIDKI